MTTATGVRIKPVAKADTAVRVIESMFLTPVWFLQPFRASFSISCKDPVRIGESVVEFWYNFPMNKPKSGLGQALGITSAPNRAG